MIALFQACSDPCRVHSTTGLSTSDLYTKIIVAIYGRLPKGYKLKDGCVRVPHQRKCDR